MKKSFLRHAGGLHAPFVTARQALFTAFAVLAVSFTALCPGGADALVGLAKPALAMGEKPQAYMVGFRTVSAATENNELISVAVWYPSQRARRAEYQTTVGLWEIKAEKNVRPARGLFPVILFSHDMAGHGLANHDLCSALAEAGFAVIAPTHYGDSSQSASALFSAALYYHRPRQLADSLAAVGRIPELWDVMNLERVGVLGYGSGAATVLQLAGVDIAPENYADYCAKAGASPAYCGDWARSRLARLPQDAAEIRSRYGSNAFTPGLVSVKAVGLLAPGGMFMLDQQRLAALPVPLATVFAGADELYPAPADDASLLELFPAPLFTSGNYSVAANVDHYSLGAPCPEQMAKTLPGICGSSGQKAREKAARERDAYFISFFRAGLGVPLAARETPPQ